MEAFEYVARATRKRVLEKDIQEDLEEIGSSGRQPTRLEALCIHRVLDDLDSGQYESAAEQLARLKSDPLASSAVDLDENVDYLSRKGTTLKALLDRLAFSEAKHMS